MIFDALQQPLAMAGLCARVRSPELAAEVYLASLLALEAGSSTAELYLDALAFRLQLPAGLAARMRAEVELMQQEAA